MTPRYLTEISNCLTLAKEPAPNGASRQQLLNERTIYLEDIKDLIQEVEHSWALIQKITVSTHTNFRDLDTFNRQKRE